LDDFGPALMLPSSHKIITAPKSVRKGHVMKMTHILLGLLTLSLSLAGARGANCTAGMKEGKVSPASIGPLAFGPDGILFVADTKGAAIFAIATDDTSPATGSQPL